jgi:hypothetical protein
MQYRVIALDELRKRGGPEQQAQLTARRGQGDRWAELLERELNEAADAGYALVHVLQGLRAVAPMLIMVQQAPVPPMHRASMEAFSATATAGREPE